MRLDILQKIVDLIDSGYWTNRDWTNWADSKISNMERPPYWLIRLSLCSDANSATDILRETLADFRYSDNDNHKDIILGYLYLRTQEQGLDIQEMLTLAWQETEASPLTTNPANGEIFQLYEDYKRLKLIGEPLSTFKIDLENMFLRNTHIAKSCLDEVVNSQSTSLPPKI